MASTSPDRDPEIRRRAAWLLGMLALVAALLVLVMVVFVGGGHKNSADDTAAPVPSATSSGSSSSPNASRSTASSAASSSASDTDTPSGSPSRGDKVSCPSDELCALDSDVGHAIEAVNAYRAEHGKDAVPGTVSDDATKCALSNGSDCSGGWVETTLETDHGRADGEAAVAKVRHRDRLLRDMSSFSVGWAYDPHEKLLQFAIVRQGD